METLTISHALWGYITRLSDFSGGRILQEFDGKTRDGLHDLSPGLDDGDIFPGIPDIRLNPHLAGFGFVRPADEAGPDTELWYLWGKCRMSRLDYYAMQLHGGPDSDAVPFYYPERVFVDGEDDDGNALSRSALLMHLKAVGIHSHHEYWWPVQLLTGLNMGSPVFRSSLKADTDLGPTWYSVNAKLSGKLPDGYKWDHYSGCKYGTLYYEKE